MARDPKSARFKRAPLHSIAEPASGERVEPCDRVAPTVEVCRPKKRVPKSRLHLAKARAVALAVECHGFVRPRRARAWGSHERKPGRTKCWWLLGRLPAR